MSESLETATLGAGCFWCVEAIFQNLKGVHQVVSGYSGGTVEQPTYQQVCTGTTGHAEVIQICFDAKIISFQDLLDVFWHTHDPTTADRQGADIGTQYRSIIFYSTEEQRAIAERSKQETDASALWASPILTEIIPFSNLYRAEEYHQNYYRSNLNQPYCQVVIHPKVRKFKNEFADKLERTQ